MTRRGVNNLGPTLAKDYLFDRKGIREFLLCKSMLFWHNHFSGQQLHISHELPTDESTLHYSSR